MRVAGLVVFCVCTAGDVFGQAPAVPQSTFDVASVKPSGGLGGLTRYLPNGGIRFIGVTLKVLVEIAYGVRPFQVIGGPGWIDTEGFDIDAHPPIDSANPTDPATPGREQRKVGERLRSLLADGFGLILHREVKEQPVYALVVAKGGPKLKESAEGKTSYGAAVGAL